MFQSYSVESLFSLYFYVKQGHFFHSMNIGRGLFFLNILKQNSKKYALFHCISYIKKLMFQKYHCSD